MSNYHTNEEVEIMKKFMGYSGVPSWIFMAFLNEQGISSPELLKEAIAAQS